MSLEIDVHSQTPSPEQGADHWLRRIRDRADVAARDGARILRDRTALTASVGRAQIDRAQSFIAFQAKRRPLTVASVAIGVGLLIGAALASGASHRRR
jgi:ElaB/YqjD/DUF883 family membrane-anchored ribosome-binding protein